MSSFYVLQVAALDGVLEGIELRVIEEQSGLGRVLGVAEGDALFSDRD